MTRECPREDDAQSCIDDLQRELPHVPRSTLAFIYRAAGKYIHAPEGSEELKAEVRRLLENAAAA